MEFEKIYDVLPWGLVLVIIGGSAFLSAGASLGESAIMDELAHIPAGYGYVRYLDYRLNPEHPPLVKLLSALPLVLEDLNFPTKSSAWSTDINGQWEVGEKFLYESGNDADRIIQQSRWGPLILTLILIIFVYIWAKELMGRWWALLPTFLSAFSPTVLAHGHFVTTDIGAALGIFLATYYLVKYLLGPSRGRLFLAGIFFGIAQLMKFSAVLLIPFFIFIVVVFYIWKGRSKLRYLSIALKIKKFFGLLISAIVALFSIFLIGYILVYIVYFVATVNYPVIKQATDTEFILTSFADGPDPNLDTCRLNAEISATRRMRCLAEIDILMAKNKILRPLAQYLLGVLMVLQRSAGGNTGYFFGEVSASGWWYYFPVSFALKEPIPSLVLIALGFVLAAWNIFETLGRRRVRVAARFFDYLGTNFSEFTMIVFIILYWTWSIKSPLNIGVRHILPTVPFLYILSAGAIKKWVGEKITIEETFWKTLFRAATSFAKLSLKASLVLAMVVWFLSEALFNYPYFLSYFNQFGGGTDKGYEYAVDSNYDWGQDLKRLKEWLEARSNGNQIDKIAVDYFGGGNPKYYLDNKYVPWWSAKGNPAKEGISWLAVSINTIQGAKGQLHPGQERKAEEEYLWLKEPYKPYARAGKSIFIYKL